MSIFQFEELFWQCFIHLIVGNFCIVQPFGSRIFIKAIETGRHRNKNHRFCSISEYQRAIGHFHRTIRAFYLH